MEEVEREYERMEHECRYLSCILPRVEAHLVEF